MTCPVSSSVSSLVGFPLELWGHLFSNLSGFFGNSDCSFPVGQRINLVSCCLVSWGRGVLIGHRPLPPPRGGQSGLTLEEMRVAFVGLLPTLFTREPLRGGDVAVPCDGQLTALSPTLAFSGAFVAENESFLAGGC